MNRTDLDIRLLPAREAPAIVEPILRSVPEWFGIEEATRMYIEKSIQLPTWAASVSGVPAGFITLARPYPCSADVFCMAVRKDLHRRGIGSALLARVEDELRRDGVRLLQVKTQGPSRPSPEYAETLKFYERVGFIRLEEFHGLWPGIPCLVLVKPL